LKDIKVKLSIIWIAHFLIWSFGDILRLLQPGYIADANASNDILLVASFIGTIQALMIVITILSDDRVGKWANLIVGAVFVLIDIGWVVEIITTSLPLWEGVLVIVYLAFDVLIIFLAYQWLSGRIKPEIS
jgi:hypothetical protein